MTYKIVQRIIRSAGSVERLVVPGAVGHSNTTVMVLRPQWELSYNRLNQRTFAISEVDRLEETKQAEGKKQPNTSSEGNDEFFQKVEEDKAEEERRTKEDDEDERIQESILSASLQFVPAYGWTKQAVEAGAESLGHPMITAGVIRDPSISLIHHHYQISNETLVKLMKQEVQELNKSGQELKVTSFLKRSIEKRLKMNIPYMSRWADALAVMTYPQNAQKSLNFGLELVDSLWHITGDKDVDFNWYTKRLTLLGIYKTTELAMMQDKSEKYAETWAFLDRRFDDSKNIKELLGAPDDALKILGAVGSTVQAFLGVKR